MRLNTTPNKVLSLFLALTLALSSILPLNLAFKSFAENNAGFRITSASFKYNNQDLAEAPAINGPFQNDDVINFTYNWEIDDEATITDLNNANVLSLNLPDVFPMDAEATGPMNDADGTLYGTYEVKNRVIKFIFNPATYASNVVGGATFGIKFKFENITITEPYTLVVPFTDTVTKTYSIKVAPGANTPSFDKDGRAINASTLEWTLDANMNLADSDGISIVDSLDSRLIFNPQSVAVYPLAVKSDGTYSVSGPQIDPALYTVHLDESQTSAPHTLTFSIGAQPGDTLPKAYRLMYNTSVNPDKIDFSQSSFTYTNSATFNGATDTKTLVVQGGSILTKAELGSNSANTNPSQLAWQVVVNAPSYPLKAVLLEDTLPAGLDFDVNADVTILNELDQDITGALMAASKINFDGGSRKLSVDFGDLAAKRTIEVRTRISQSTILDKPSTNTNNYHSFAFTNSAVLSQSQNGLVNTTSVSSTLNTKVGKMVHKTGSASIGYNANKTIAWNLFVNLGNLNTASTTVTDTSDARLTLPALTSGFVVKPVTVNANGDLTYGAALTEGANYNVVFDDQDPTHKFSVVFTNAVTSAYVIQYTTSINAPYVSGNYTNVGTFNGTSYTGTVNASISNSVSKANTNIDGLGTAYDYATKTYEWRLTMDPRKEAMQDHQIVDTLSSGLFMTQDQIDGLVVKKAAQVLVKDIDYTLVPSVVGGKIKGFTLDFLVDVNDAIYYVDYKTTIDPDVLSTNGNLTYSNTATFDWTTNGAPQSKTANPNPSISNLVKYNGSKSGTLDLANKEVNWQIDLNYLSKNLNSLVVTDQIALDANGSGLKLKPGSIQVYTDTVDSTGALKSNNLTLLSPADLSANGIVITENTAQNSFSVTFSQAISKPYRLVYTTDMVGISSTQYANTATTNVGEAYSATVNHNLGHTFVDKTGARNNDRVDWDLTVNPSKSTIHNLVIIDTLNEGLTLDQNSFELYKNGAPLVFADYFDLVVDARALASDPQRFTLTAKTVIDDTLVIKYSTTIVVDYIVSTDFSNTATISGQHIVNGTTTKTASISHNIMQSNGWGIGQLGSITLQKHNEEGQALPGAVFDFYKGVNKIGTLISDNLGQIIVSKLKFGTYSFVETTAPAGFQLPSPTANATTTVNVNAVANFPITVQNYTNRTLEITKYEANTQKVLAGAVFEVKQNGNVLHTLTTDNAGKASVALAFGTYSVEEKTAPSGYEKSAVVEQVVIDAADQNADHTPKLVYGLSFQNVKKVVERPQSTEDSPVATTAPTTAIPTTTAPSKQPNTQPKEGVTEPRTQTTTEVTPENTPKDGVIPVPEGSKPEIKTPPTNGDIVIDDTGKWTYTPDPDFKGKDTFEVVIVNPDGSQDLITIDIEIEDGPIALGGLKLPQTGEASMAWVVLLGGLTAFVGAVFFFRKK